MDVFVATASLLCKAGAREDATHCTILLRSGSIYNDGLTITRQPRVVDRDTPWTEHVRPTTHVHVGQPVTRTHTRSTKRRTLTGAIGAKRCPECRLLSASRTRRNQETFARDAPPRICTTRQPTAPFAPRVPHTAAALRSKYKTTNAKYACGTEQNAVPCARKSARANRT